MNAGQVQRFFNAVYFVALPLLLAMWSAELLRRYPIVMEFADTLPLSRSLLGQFQAVPGSLLAIVYSHLETAAPAAMAAVTKTGISLEAVQTWLVHISMWMGFGGMYLATWKISGSHWAGLLAALLLPVSWLKSLSVGYGLFFWIHHPALGAMGGAWVIAVWAVWLCLAWHRLLWPVPYVLCGLLFYIHPTNAMILGLCFGVATVLTSLQEWRAGSFRIRTWFGVILLGTIVLPGIAKLIFSVAPTANFDAASWWALMTFRKPHHVLIWSTSAVLSVIGLAAISIALVGILARFGRRHYALMIVGTLLPCFALAGIGYAVVEIAPSPRLAGLVLSRSLDLVVAAAVVTLASLVAIAFDHAEYGHLARRIAFYSAATILPIAAVALSLGPLTTPIVVSVLGTGAVAVTGALLISPGATLRQAPRRYLEVGLALAVGMCLLPSIEAEAKNLASYNPSNNWSEVTSWLKTNTPTDSLVMMPPYPAGIYASDRADVIDHLYNGYSVYIFDALSFELNALNNIYGIDLKGKTIDEVRSMVAASNPPYPNCLYERGYLNFISDKQRILVSQEVFGFKYLVGFQPTILPDEWICSTTVAERVDLPIAFENGAYVIYRLTPDAVSLNE